MNYKDYRFGEDDDRDRTVPEKENYYRSGYKPAYGEVINSDNYDESVSEDETTPDTSVGYAFDDIFSNSGGVNPAEDYEREQPRREKPVRKKKKKKNKLVPILAVLLVLVIIVSASGFSVLGKISYDDKTANAYVHSSELISSPAVKNILLLGVDARAGEDGETSRSDTMLLISFDSANNCIKMTSFLRDTWIYIPCKDRKQRLNAACSYGGYSGVVDTLEYNFGIKIDGYLVTDFELFTVMVDSIGGVEIDVTEAEAKEVTNHKGRYGNVTLEAGNHLLTGEQALAYCRIRKIDTDWKRTERQRTVMEAIIKKALRAGPFTAFGTLSSAAPYIETDLSKGELMSLGFKALGCISGGFEQASCPFEGTWSYANISGASVISLSVDENKDKLVEFIYGE